MSKPHKHAEVIKAWAEGKKIQAKIGDAPDWSDVPEGFTPAFEYPHTAWRIKPEQAYPSSKMTRKEVCDAAGTAEEPVLVLYFFKVANAALRHAIEAGQVVAADDEIIVMGRESRAARDMAIAEAVKSACVEAVDMQKSNIVNIVHVAEIIAKVK